MGDPSASINQSMIEVLDQKTNEKMEKGDETELLPISYSYDYPNYYRWLIVTFFSIMSVLIGPTFFNWPPLFDIFSKANAYSHLCKPTDPTFELRSRGEIYCLNKNLAISSMFPVTVTTMFAFDLVAGMLLDCVGSKITCLAGILCQCLGWVIIGVSGRSFNGYLFGLVLQAAGADPSFFGLLSVANLFPGWESTIIAVLGSARSLSYANCLIMQAVLKSGSITLPYVAFAWAIIVLACGVLTFFFVPFQSFPKLPIGSKLERDENQDGKTKYSEVLTRKPQVNFKVFKKEAKDQFKGFLQYGLTLNYALFCILPAIAMLRNSYYSVSFAQHLPNTIQLYSLLNPLSFIPCPLVGIFSDRVSTTLTILGLAVFGAISMFLVMFRGIAFEYLSLFLNFIFISFCISQFYCYISYIYPQKEMGKLIGVALLIGGLVSLAATPMFDFATKARQFFTMDLIIVCLELVAIVVCLYLYFKMEVPIRRAMGKATEKDIENNEALDNGVETPTNNSGSSLRQ